ncbi:hypothetical protein J6590_071395 [Homalodisca vitripennis]|nr:hypothetical protein J6590_071395 [Homalodisca vitripennis]
MFHVSGIFGRYECVTNTFVSRQRSACVWCQHGELLFPSRVTDTGTSVQPAEEYRGKIKLSPKQCITNRDILLSEFFTDGQRHDFERLCRVLYN